MVEFLRTSGRRGWAASLVHAAFNAGLAGAIFALIVIFPEAPWLAFVLVLLAKWRVVAVRPRYWWANFLGNLPDLFVGLAFVTLMWRMGDSTGLGATEIAKMNLVWAWQLGLAILYAAWLILLKPRHQRKWVIVQAGVAQFLSLNALAAVGFWMPVWAFVLASFVVAFVCARQILANYSEKNRDFLAAVWGLIVAEVAFAVWHWTFGFAIVLPTLRVAQFAVLAGILGYIAERSYRAWHNDQRITFAEVGLQMIGAVVLLLVVLFAMSGLWEKFGY